ncbi:MAG: hypothetical protein KGZ93_10715 [Actinobacteria bacterium]|nr:hypothetical protein [Actinomycetota bacterium]
MKKALAILPLVGILVLSMAGSAFANPIYQGGWGNWNTAIKHQNVNQSATIVNAASATSGSAGAIGNNSIVPITTRTSAIALHGTAKNRTNITANSFGFAVAASAPATSFNVVDNDVVQVVVQ